MLGEDSFVSSEEEQSISDDNEFDANCKVSSLGVIKRQKGVRFADECGFCLESVRLIVSECF